MSWPAPIRGTAQKYGRGRTIDRADLATVVERHGVPIGLLTNIATVHPAIYFALQVADPSRGGGLQPLAGTASAWKHSRAGATTQTGGDDDAPRLNSRFSSRFGRRHRPGGPRYGRQVQ